MASTYLTRTMQQHQADIHQLGLFLVGLKRSKIGEEQGIFKDIKNGSMFLHHFRISSSSDKLLWECKIVRS